MTRLEISMVRWSVVPLLIKLKFILIPDVDLGCFFDILD
jgi:hypothetical protein